jgi:ketopantoate reductase
MMRHAVLGAGGVGAFLGAALSRAGRDVLLLMREESLARYGGVVRVESVLLGDFEAEVPAAPRLERPVDVVWVATKATQLADALERVPEAAGLKARSSCRSSTGSTMSSCSAAGSALAACWRPRS